MSTALQRETRLSGGYYEAARAALEKVRTYDEVKDIRDKAIAFEAYARQAKDTQLVEDAVEIKKRAERHVAEMIEAERKVGNLAKQGQPKKGSTHGTLNSVGISKTQAHRWGRLAKMSKPDFEKHIEDSKLAVRHSLDPAPESMDVHYSSETPEWYTPPEIIKRVERALGKIDLDPCSAGEKTIPAAKVYTKKEDGLSREWWGRVYMNPPYGREISAWVEKLVAEHTAGRVKQAIALVPARVDTAWFRMFRDAAVCFVDGRLKFSGSQNSAPFPSAAIYLGNNIPQFAQSFSDMGDIWVRWNG